MRIVFLDIDGVLNKDTTKERIKTPPYTDFQGLDPELLKRFDDWYLSQADDVAIVISSTWRLHESLLEELAINGLEWIGVTPRLPSELRGGEVKKFLSDYDQPVSRFAIVDDIKDWFNEDQMEFLVHTDYKKGLTEAKLKELDMLING